MNDTIMFDKVEIPSTQAIRRKLRVGYPVRVKSGIYRGQLGRVVRFLPFGLVEIKIPGGWLAILEVDLEPQEKLAVGLRHV